MDANSAKQFNQLYSRSAAAVQRVSQPESLARLQQVVFLFLLLWGVHSSASLFWAMWPSQAINVSNAALINPVTSAATTVESQSIDVSSLLELGLFGEPVTEAVLAASIVPSSNPREGIEQGARETTLDLILTGIVASTEDGLGTAIIESKKRQSNYAVGDALPVAGSVKVAKVMPAQVVLDNNGTYELLVLYDETKSGVTVTGAAAYVNNTRPSFGQNNTRQDPKTTSTGSAEIRIDTAESIDLAAGYRQQLYENPQALADLVTVSAVRGDDGLRGYRIAPGRSPDQFRAFGFEAGDVVVAVNGMPLSDPANTVRLYQTMRNARDATFEVERRGTSVTISVSLGSL